MLDKYSNLLRAHRWLKEQSNESWREKQLVSVAQHACRHVPYYRDLAKSVGLKPERDLLTARHVLTRLPVTNADAYRELQQTRGDAYVLDERLRTDDLVSMRSSGSSGTPLNVFRSPLEHAIDTICTVHMFTNSGFRWHDKMLVFKTPHAVVKSDSMIQRFGVFYRKTISVHSEFEEARHLIETQKFNILMGYSAHIELLAEHLSQSGGSLPQFRSVFLGGEKITKTRREKVQRLLKPEFLMEYYGSTESGNIAHKLEHAYVVEPKTVYISRDEEIESMAPGAVSILLSSLFMFGQPLINYRIGDQIIDAQENDAGRIIQFESVLGRSNDQLIDKNNSRWSGIRFYAPIEGHPCVRRFVVQQFEAGALEIQIIPTPESNRADREDFEAMTNKLFAQDFKVSLEFVDDIPLAASGKFKVIQQHLST